MKKEIPSVKEVTEQYSNRFLNSDDPRYILSTGSRDRELIRFNALVESGIVDGSTVLDLGCGIGNFYKFLKENFKEINYIGVDLVPEFIDYCNKEFKDEAKFYCEDMNKIIDSLDYIDVVVSSQCFNRKMSDQDNGKFARSVIEKVFNKGARVISMDFLSDNVDFQEERLQYHSVVEMTSFASKLTNQFSIRHNYPLFEFNLSIYQKFKGWRSVE